MPKLSLLNWATHYRPKICTLITLKFILQSTVTHRFAFIDTNVIKSTHEIILLKYILGDMHTLNSTEFVK